MFSHKERVQDDLIDRASYWVLLALTALIPIAVYIAAEVPTSMTKILVAGSLTFISVILFSFARLKEQRLSIPRSLLLAAAWLLPAAYVLSTLFSSNASISLYGDQLTMDNASFFIVGALALTLTALSITNMKRALGLYLAMLGSAVVLTVLQLIIFFSFK